MIPLAQWGGFGQLERLLIALVVLVTVWAIIVHLMNPPEKVKVVVNYVGLAVLAILAIVVLFSFL
jgi:hypothetical protein